MADKQTDSRIDVQKMNRFCFISCMLFCSRRCSSLPRFTVHFVEQTDAELIALAKTGGR